MRPGQWVRAGLAAMTVATTAAPRLPAAHSAAPPSMRFPVGSPAMATAQGIARMAWGADACGGQVAIRWARMAPLINAGASWANDGGIWSSPAANTDCSVVLNAAVAFDWPKLCTVLVHEYGHLTGHRHSPNPRSVMYAYYVRPYPPCARVRDPNARAPEWWLRRSNILGLGFG